MKKLPLKNASYRYLVTSFQEWLDVQGYAPSTVYNLPNHIRELLHYLEALGIHQIKALEQQHITAFYHHLKQRSHTLRGGGLSNGHLNKHIQALRRFTEYLWKVGRLVIPDIRLANEATEQQPLYLTEAEITLLFKATHLPITPKMRINVRQQEALQSRDRAMLAIFYGCGLRRSEGVALDVSDINFDRSLLQVRKGKNYKARFVPISKISLKHLQEYIYDHRDQLARSNTLDALFLSQRGLRMQGQSLYLRLKQLQYCTEDIDLQQKEIGLHTLRHSIATHLLSAGMPLESISRFLGHESLVSTQLYTHLQLASDERKGVAVTSKTDHQPYANLPGYEPIQLSEDERGI